MYLEHVIKIYRFVDRNLTNIMTTVVLRCRVNKISKCFVQRGYVDKKFLQTFEYFHQERYLGETYITRKLIKYQTIIFCADVTLLRNEMK